LKLGRVIGLFLLKHHRVALPGFGIIMHDADALVEGQDGEEPESFAAGSLSFIADPKVSPDELLLEFISRETGKMKSLAKSDMDSFLQFGLELINISKPFHLEGIGILQKNAKNQLEFLQSSELIPQDPFSRNSSPSGSRKRRMSAPSPDLIRKLSLGLLLILLLLAATMTVRWFINRPVSEEIPEPDTQISLPTSSTDTLQLANKPASTSGSDHFGVVLEQSSRQRAFKRFADLKEWGHNVRMVTKDSVTFKLYILINAPMRDTAKYRDSLRIFFNRRVWIETHPDEKP
jgi:hypothetical protein